MKNDLPIERIPGIGTAYTKKLQSLNIFSVEDLIYHFPFRYEDYSNKSTINKLIPNQMQTVQGAISSIKNIRTRKGKFITVAKVTDGSGILEIIWFNQPYLTKSLKNGVNVSLSGKIKLDGRSLKMLAPAYEILKIRPILINNSDTLHTGKIVSIYPETEGLSSKWIRANISKILPNYLDDYQDILPRSALKRLKLNKLDWALENIHLPKSEKDITDSRKRLAFDEIFLVQIISLIRQKEWSDQLKASPMKIDQNILKDFITNLPFKLTHDQEKAIEEITSDINNSFPANRLLEGEVGSGKTIVAAVVSLVAALCGFETIIAAPTEILAFQHYDTLSKLFKKSKIDIGIWTGSKKQKGIITCGTHALLSSYKSKKGIGLVIVDEQHRFGVAQRNKLIYKGNKKLTPHLITMTATPIPRTLALTMYGELNLSLLSEIPGNRPKISTHVVPEKKRDNAYKFIADQIKKGRQAFILTPFVEPSETMQSVKSAVNEFEKLRSLFSDDISLGLLHGKLQSNEKASVINKFKSHKTDILVTTPVVEVGIDIPNATIMLIESAERFGLAQLHQIRGRVGRGEHKSYCFLFSDNKSEKSSLRLKSMENIDVGFELAEIDLKMRGSGELFGFKQSGFDPFRFADLSDLKTISMAQKEARRILSSDPSLKRHKYIDKKISTLRKSMSGPN